MSLDVTLARIVELQRLLQPPGPAPVQSTTPVATASSFAGVRPQIATRAPSRIISRAVASPMPEPPPVTIATWSRRICGAKTR